MKVGSYTRYLELNFRIDRIRRAIDRSRSIDARNRIRIRARDVDFEASTNEVPRVHVYTCMLAPQHRSKPQRLVGNRAACCMRECMQAWGSKGHGLDDRDVCYCAAPAAMAAPLCASSSCGLGCGSLPSLASGGSRDGDVDVAPPPSETDMVGGDVGCDPDADAEWRY